MIQIYCGDGKGKTTASVGLSVRAAGSGKKVLFVQFLKNGESSEIEVLDRIKNMRCMYYPLNLGFFNRMDEKTKGIAKKEYEALFDRAVNMFTENQMDVIVLDEFMAAYNYDMLDREKAINFLNSAKDNNDIEVILTGRNPSEELLSLADYVSEVKKIKHPYDNGVPARKGIEY